MEKNLKDISGKRIRRQYFNAPLIVLYSLMFAIPYAIFIYQVGLGKFDTSELPSTLWTSIWVCFCFSIPFLILRMLNKHFFGRIICVLTKEGIHYAKGMLHWETVEKIEYVFASKPGNVILYTQGGMHVVLNNAPLHLLSRIRKHNKGLEIKISGVSSLLSVVLLIAAIIAIAPLYIIMLIKSPGADSISRTGILIIVLSAIALVLLPIRQYVFDKYAIQYRFWRRILPKKVLSYILLGCYYISYFAAILVLFYFPNWVTACLLGIFVGVIESPMPSKHGRHHADIPTYDRLYDTYISHADLWERNNESKTHKK